MPPGQVPRCALVAATNCGGTIIPSAAGSPSALALRIKRLSAHRSGLGWPTAPDAATHHRRYLSAPQISRNYAAMNACRCEHRHPWSGQGHLAQVQALLVAGGLVQRFDQRRRVGLELVVVKRRRPMVLCTIPALSAGTAPGPPWRSSRPCTSGVTVPTEGWGHRPRLGPGSGPTYPPRASRPAQQSPRRGMSPALTMAARSSYLRCQRQCPASSALAPCAGCCDTGGLAGTRRQHHGTAHHLVGLLGVPPNCTATSIDSSNLAGGSILDNGQSLGGVQTNWIPPCPERAFAFGPAAVYTLPPSRPWSAQNPMVRTQHPRRLHSCPSSWSWQFLPTGRG